MIREYLSRRKEHLARRKLQKLVEEKRDSFETRDFRKRREAALRGRRASA